MKTLARVSERYWWPRLNLSVRKYVLSCLFCQFHKPAAGPSIGLLQPIPPPDRPFHTVGVDHLGPFQLTAEGNAHVLMSIDYLTKWVEAAAVPDTSTAPAVRFIQDSINCRHGHPTRIISDQGTAFTSHQMEEAMERWRIHHVFATAEHPPKFRFEQLSNRVRKGRML